MVTAIRGTGMVLSRDLVDRGLWETPGVADMRWPTSLSVSVHLTSASFLDVTDSLYESAPNLLRRTGYPRSSN